MTPPLTNTPPHCSPLAKIPIVASPAPQSSKQPPEPTEQSPAPSWTIDDLLLIRIALAGPTGATITMARRSLESLLEQKLSTETMEAICHSLCQQSFLTNGARRGRFLPTAAGTERAVELLGIKRFPPRSTWTAVCRDYLFPRAAGLTTAEAKKLQTATRLTAWDLKKRYRLPEQAGSTVKQISEAIVCQRLGYPQATTLKQLQRCVLSELMQAPGLTDSQLLAQLPLFQTNLPSMSAALIREKYIRDAVMPQGDESPSTAPATAQTPPLSAAASPAHSPVSSDAAIDRSATDSSPADFFAQQVLAIARKTGPEARHYDRKVYIYALWQAWKSQANAGQPDIGLEAFKRRLLDANRSGQLSLGRADLVQTMDHDLMRRSEVVFLNARFHFVLID